MHSLLSFGQDAEKEKVSNRIFMPSIQMGYIHNLASELSGGLFIQTSIEYQTSKGIFFRINYDDFDSDYELLGFSNSSGSLSGKVSFAEFIGGIGYRQTKNKHSILVGVQAGARFYGYPFLTIEGNNTSLELDNRQAPINRYTVGYEFEIDTRAFLTLELLGSHVWKKQDYWEENVWSTGFTIGITTTIF